MEIKKDFRNELFKRQELVVGLEGDKNPSFDEVADKIAEHTGKPKDNVDVKKVEGSFGKNVFTGEVYVYDSKEDLEEMRKLEMTAKARKEGAKPAEEGAEGGAEGGEASVESSEAPADEKPAESAEAPVEDSAPVEDKPEEEAKADKEEKQAEEESKEN